MKINDDKNAHIGYIKKTLNTKLMHTTTANLLIKSEISSLKTK